MEPSTSQLSRSLARLSGALLAASWRCELLFDSVGNNVNITRLTTPTHRSEQHNVPIADSASSDAMMRTSLQVNSVALQPGYNASNPVDPARDGHDGCEGSWQRCKVEAHLSGVPLTLQDRWLKIVMHCAEVMYSPEAAEDERSALVADEPIADGYAETDDEDAGGTLDRWRVAPEHVRPWQPFEPPSALWPVPALGSLSNGDAVLYVDKNDRSIRWNAHIRRKFSNGVWLWVVGPQGHTWHYDTDHHAACCTDDSDQWAATQHNRSSYVVSPIERHLRRARHFDPATGHWDAACPTRAFYDCTWLVDKNVKPRPTSDGKAFCTQQSSADALKQVQAELRGKLLGGDRKKRFLVDLWRVMEFSGFLHERSWDAAGQPGDEVNMRDWTVRYLGTCIEQVHQQRKHSVNSGTAHTRKVAKMLEGDVDYLHDAATRFYVHEHHPGAAVEFAWSPAAAA